MGESFIIKEKNYENEIKKLKENNKTQSQVFEIPKITSKDNLANIPIELSNNPAYWKKRYEEIQKEQTKTQKIIIDYQKKLLEYSNAESLMKNEKYLKDQIELRENEITKLKDFISKLIIKV
jgi:hypothetical protein